MTDWQKLEDAVAGASELPDQARASWLAEFCGSDAELFREAMSLVANQSDASDFLESSVTPYTAVLANDGSRFSGKQLGQYTIIREIGRGGMGTVFLAERSDGEFEQQVALKIVRQSIAERHTIERFKTERQILASLNHPNIARLLDGGISEDGLPYIAMEYVEGESILDYATRSELGLSARLELFLKVCSAVAYAHRNLIVHRDIKPGNILVDAAGEPKLLDFGLAKLVDESSPDDPSQTQTAFRALTPAYASPEQLRGQPLTTVSDVYSLGVVLFELLTGERPYRFENKSLEEIIRTVTEVSPVWPSQIGARRIEISRDLDNIVLMALRSEPERRYASVDKFADDVSRFLAGLPVFARPNTFGYRSAKFLSRHRIGVATAVLVLITLVAGIFATAWQARKARLAKEKAEGINLFLEQTLNYSNPYRNRLKRGGQDVTINEVLNEAARRLDSGEFDGDPELKLELERTVASTYFGQGAFQRAREHMARYVELLRSQYGERDIRFEIGMTRWAILLFAKGEMDEAESIFRKYVPPLREEKRRGNLKPAEFAEIVNNFAYLRRTQGDSREAETLFRETLGLIPEIDIGELGVVATTKSTLASTLADQGKFNEAISTATEAVDEYAARNETNSPNFGFSLTVLGGFLIENGDLASARTDLERAEDIFRRLLAPKSLWLGDDLRNQAICLYKEGKYEESLTKADEVRDIYSEEFGEHYDQYPTVLIYQGLALAALGRSKDAEPLLRKAVELRRSALPAEHFWVAAADGALGEFLAKQGRSPEAEPLLRSSYESLRSSQEPDSPRVAEARKRLDLLAR